MNIDWTTLGINAAISLVLSLIVFSLGLRAGKERIDRKELREKYRKLTVHFEKIHKKMKDNEPLDWNGFPTEDRNGRGSSIPFVRQMIRDGEHLELDPKLMKTLEELEVESLKYGYYFTDLSKNAGDVVVKALEKNMIPLDKQQYSITTKVTDDTENTSYMPYNPAKLLYKENINKFISLIQGRDTGVNFQYIIKSTYQFNIHLRKNDMSKIDLVKIVNEIHLELNKMKDSEIDKKEELLNKLEKPIKKLKKLTKEPYSFWATIRNTFKDIFS